MMRVTGMSNAVTEQQDSRWARIRARKLVDPAVRERYERTRRTVAAIRETLMRVDRERAQVGLTKAELARRLGTNPSNMRRLLSSGRSNPTLKTVLELCDVLGLEVTLRPKHEPTGPDASGRDRVQAHTPAG
jgi:ribosome-binding protein aMBF1 (putative translation factor)